MFHKYPIVLHTTSQKPLAYAERIGVVWRRSLLYLAAMSDPIEQLLRRSMVHLGHAVELVIGKASKAGTQIATRGGIQPVLSLESQLAHSRVRELIEKATHKIFVDAVPNLKGMSAIEIGEGPASYGPQFLSHQAKFSLSVEIGGGSIGRQGDATRGFVVRGASGRLPVQTSLFKYVLARLASPLQGDMTRAFREIGRIMQPGAQGVIIDYHPYGSFSKRGDDRLRPIESGITRIEDYYRLSKKIGLRVVDLREVLIDEELRQFFYEEEIQTYRNLKGSPFLICLFIYKPRSDSHRE